MAAQMATTIPIRAARHERLQVFIGKWRAEGTSFAAGQTKMTKHVMEKHPDVAKEMEKMHNEDPKKWGQEMKSKWDATVEDEPMGRTMIMSEQVTATARSDPKPPYPTRRCGHWRS